MRAPKIENQLIELSLADLHCVVCGEGEPLIMVPATISEVDNWKGMIQFMGTRFKTWFFELPGHGKSEAFKEKFSSDLVAEMVEQLIDKLGLERFNLMGFSFGGILTLKTLTRLENRIDKVIMFAPHVTNKALLFSRRRIELLRLVERMLERKKIQALMLKAAHNQKTVNLVLRLFNKIGNVEIDGPRKKGFRDKLMRLPASTLEVLVHQIEEILNFEFPEKEAFPQTCYFGMSVNDPLLSYQITEDALEQGFKKLVVKKFDFPYHQPPKPLEFQELTRDYKQFLDQIK